jgi:cytochrome c556
MQAIRLAALAVVCALAGVAATGHGDEPKEKKKPSLMQKKLTHAQAVLEGLALNDFARIADSADELTTISKAAEWQMLKTATYELYSNEFRRATESLKKQAKAKSGDGATLAYVEMTFACVKCHQHVRDQRIGRLDRIPDDTAITRAR